MLTSMQPLPKPKTTTAAPSAQTFSARPGSTREPLHSTAATGSVRWLPNRSLSGPASCSPAKAPPPMHSSSQPSTAWEMPALTSTEGMCTTHTPMTKPLSAKYANVPRRARCRSGPGGGRPVAVRPSVSGLLPSSLPLSFRMHSRLTRR